MNAYQIPRNSLAWILAAQAGVCLPHIVRLPIWISAVCLACGVWRVMIYQGRWSYPGRLVKSLLVLGGFIGIPVGYSKLSGLEPAIALLIVAFFLKLLEMHHKKDAYIVILLAYFVVITEFLFFQTIPYTIYMLVVVIMITAALIGLNQTKTHTRPLKTFRSAAVLVGQSLPLMLVLFVFFPRITPLWTVAAQSSVARTGVSNSMSPGDIALLTQSDDLAFQATFESKIPSKSQLYWRGLVLSKFDGKTWEQSEVRRAGVWRQRQKRPEWVDAIEYKGDEYRYNVVLEPTQRNWLFALTIPELPESRELMMLADYSLVSRRKLRQRLRYQLSSNLDYVLSKEISQYSKYWNTLIPDESNPQTQVLAKKLFKRAGDPKVFISDVLQMYNQQEFSYTLRPPKLGEHDIDEFILGTRRGFCEHYAGSFVFMMRAAGIPARVVVGYLGGEYNPRGNYISVRQFDAHAWAEVWLEGLGWTRIDPTSAVAPERIEGGLEAAVADENSFLSDLPLSIFRYRQLLWLTDFRLQMDAIGHYWDTWVVGYTEDTQEGLLRRLLGDVDQKQLGVIMLTVFFSILGVIALLLFAKPSKAMLTPVNAEYLKFCTYMEGRGYARRMGEGPTDYAARMAIEKPELRGEINALTTEFIRANYIDAKPKDSTRLKKAIRALRLKTLRMNI